jgi:hypothetical protein
MNQLKIFGEGLCIFGGLFFMGLIAVTLVLIMMGACAMHICYCEDQE